jgi:hypothetical protein
MEASSFNEVVQHSPCDEQRWHRPYHTAESIEDGPRRNAPKSRADQTD